MLAAIVSDSHYGLVVFQKLLSHLKEENIKHLIHAGDFLVPRAEEIVTEYTEIQFYIAIGNCDENRPALNRIGALDHVSALDYVISFDLGGLRFGVSHVDGHAENHLRGKEIDVFIHGHTHRARIEKQGNVLRINPGSLTEGAGYMLLDTSSLEVERKSNF